MIRVEFDLCFEHIRRKILTLMMQEACLYPIQLLLSFLQ